jgi:hypothetical protein
MSKDPYANSRPSAQNARTDRNAAAANTFAPKGQDRSRIPNPDFKPMVLPPVMETQPKPAFGPGTKRSGGK